MSAPFCVDCKWYRSGYRVDGGGCQHPHFGISLVTGARKEGSLEFERNSGLCGPQGVNFEPRPPAPKVAKPKKSPRNWFRLK